ncbi:MAG TPA: hypothetical protein VMP11_10600 [Verrucomicrobiae bacterium]|nr:hypothetical protein [Verrucomicrobiae bacterium]
MRQEIVDYYLSDPVAFARLEDQGLVWDKIDRKTGNFRHLPLHCPSPMSTTLKSRRFDSVVARLRELNSLRYDVFVCPNPLSYGHRYQATVIGVRVLVLEGDDDDKQAWLNLLERRRECFLLAVDSGNRSIHLHVPIPPIRNPHCVHSWRDLQMMMKHDLDTTVDLAPFHRKAEKLEALARSEGVNPDPNVLKNFASLVRCPGFRHSLTGRMARLIHVRSGSVPSSSGAGGGDTVGWKGVVGVETRNRGVESEKTGVSVEEARPEGRAGNPMLQAPDTVGTSFLDDLDRYQRLKTEGIPARHRRVGLHRVMFTAGRLWGWLDDEHRLREGWRAILSIHPHNIGCSVDQGVEDIVRHAGEAGDFKFHLPCARALPDLDQGRVTVLQEHLQAEGCPHSVSASRIIARVLYPIVRRCPGACLDGTAAVRSREVQLASVNQQYKPAMEWLETHNIMVVANRSYSPGIRSRLYRINVPLVLWLLGFRTADLVWRWTVSQDEADQDLDWTGGLEPNEPSTHEMSVELAIP